MKLQTIMARALLAASFLGTMLAGDSSMERFSRRRGSIAGTALESKKDMSARKLAPSYPIDPSTLTVTPLHWAAVEGNVADIKALTAEEGVDIDAPENLYGGETPLHWAAFAGHAGAVRALLAAGASADARDDDGETALRESLRTTFGSAADVVPMMALLASGADPTAKSADGSTALHEAVAHDLTENVALQQVSLLRMFGADPNARWTEAYNQTPLHTLAFYAPEGALGSLAALLSDQFGPGADAKAKDNIGWTPLHYAAWSGSVEIAQMLLDIDGVDVNSRANNGDTPLRIAMNRGNQAVADVLRSAGSFF